MNSNLLRIATYNIYLGRPERLEPLYQVMAHTAADVFTLTEADDPAVVAALAERLEMYFVWAAGSGDHHIATLSRFPITAWQIYNRPPLTQAVLQTTLALPTGALTLYGLHFLPFLLLPFEARRRQAIGRLLHHIRANPPGPHLILGDFNSIGPGDRVLQRRNPPRMRRVMALQLWRIFRLAVPRLLSAGYTDCFRRLHPTADGFTWYPGNPTTRYDYIMADAALAACLRRCRVIDSPELLDTMSIASDHMPLVADFDLSALKLPAAPENRP